MIGVLGHDSALLRLYWAGDNLRGQKYEYKARLAAHMKKFWFVQTAYTVICVQTE